MKTILIAITALATVAHGQNPSRLLEELTAPQTAVTNQVTQVPRETFRLETRLDNLARGELTEAQGRNLAPDRRYLTAYQSLFSQAASTNRVQGIQAIRKLRRMDEIVEQIPEDQGGPLHPFYLVPALPVTNQVRIVVGPSWWEANKPAETPSLRAIRQLREAGELPARP